MKEKFSAIVDEISNSIVKPGEVINDQNYLDLEINIGERDPIKTIDTLHKIFIKVFHGYKYYRHSLKNSLDYSAFLMSQNGKFESATINITIPEHNHQLKLTIATDN